MHIKHLEHWKTSTQGTPLELYKSIDSKKAPLLLIGGVHGDEPEGVHLAKSLLNYLKNEPSQIPWILVPCINPDGISQNRRVNHNGVDLNRNYPAKSWSPDFEKKRYFPGNQPNSELETQALVELIQKYKPEVLIHFHSWKPCIVLSGPDTHPYATALSQSSGYKIQSNIGYPTPGSLSDYGWTDNNIPVICIEESEGIAKEEIWPKWKSGFERIFKS